MTLLSTLVNYLPSSWANELIKIQTSTSVVGQALPIENIWKGDIPTKITYPIDTYSQKLEFPIQGLLPYATLADKLNGVDVYFEIWAQSGKKLGYDTIYSFDWNPVGPNTLVSMYLYPDDVVGLHTMIIRTEATLSNTGLISRYLKGEIRVPIQIVGVSKPGEIEKLSAQWGVDGLEYAMTTSGTAVREYEVGLSYLLSSTSDKTQNSNYSSIQVIKTINNKTFSVTYQEFIDWLVKNNLPIESTTINLRTRGKNEGGVGNWGAGIYVESSEINQQQKAYIAKAEIAAREKAALERDAKMPPGFRPSSGSINGANIEINLQASDENKSYTKIESGIQYLLDPNSSTLSGTYSEVEVWNSSSNTTFLIPINDLRYFLQAKFSDISTTSLRFAFRGVNDFGTSDWGQTIFVSGEKLFPVEASSRKQAEAANNEKTIKCIKGKKVKKVTGVKPKCPKGYKKKG